MAVLGMVATKLGVGMRQGLKRDGTVKYLAIAPQVIRSEWLHWQDLELQQRGRAPLEDKGHGWEIPVDFE